jgi:nitroreductase
MSTLEDPTGGTPDATSALPSFDDVVIGRRSCRAFLPDPVPEVLVDRLFALAQRSPSWCNVQPWQVELVSAPRTEALATVLLDRASSGPANPDLPLPQAYLGVYEDRRQHTGQLLYDSLGIRRDDRPSRRTQALANFSFFGAPHVAIITTDRALGVYGAVDCGGFVSTLTLAAHALGLGSVPQAAIAMYSDTVRQHLGLPEDRLVVCAVSFGRPDPHHPANHFRTPRADTSQVIAWHR